MHKLKTTEVLSLLFHVLLSMAAIAVPVLYWLETGDFKYFLLFGIGLAWLYWVVREAFDR